jgi:predicted ATPase
MEVVELRIDGFRGIRQGRVRFGTHTVLVGPNNCGKTTIIEALALLFGRDRMVRGLTEHDFYGGCPEPADRIRLVATVAGFDDDDPSNHLDWFREERGILKWWSPSQGIVSATKSASHHQLACQIGFCARFDHPSLEVETVRYFHDDDDVIDPFNDELISTIPARIIRELGFFLVPASRTWDRVVSFGSELFRRVVASAGGQPAGSVIGERDRLRLPPQPLEADENLEPIVARLNQELSGFFRSQPELQLRVTTTDSDGLLEAVVPHYRHQSAALGLPARRHGSGLLSLQHLLLLFEFGRIRSSAGEGFWMALEEPELHVPPPLQRRLVHRLQALSSQTFVTTHSPMIAAMCNPTTVSVLRNENGQLSSAPLLAKPLQPDTPNGVRRLFQMSRIETISALMHDCVLVPEGSSDHEWLRLLVTAVDLYQGWNTEVGCGFSCFVGVIPTHDASVEATVSVLQSLHPQIAALVDGDAQGIGYTAALAAMAEPPSAILRWPDGWTIEDVIGWIIEADEAGVLAELQHSIHSAPATVPDLIGRLRSKERSTGGLKGDRLAYDAVAGAIGSRALCRDRARSLLDAVADAALGASTSKFAADPQSGSGTQVFQP